MEKNAWAVAPVPDGDLTASRIGSRVRRIRVERDWSTRDLAARIGVAVHVVTDVESGVRRPTIELLYRLAAGLQVPPGDLFPPDDEHPRIAILLPVSDEPGASLAQVIGGGPGNPTQTYLYDLPAGESDGGFGRHPGQELLVVIHGEVVCSSLSGPDEVVRAGGSKVIDTAEPHGIRATDSGPARFLLVCTDDCEG